MKRYFINGIGCVSAQDTTNPDFDFDSCEELSEEVVYVHKPVYRDYIKPAMIRRMSTGVKIGVVASAIALKDAGISEPEAIITGSGMGGQRDSEKFLENILNNNEQFLTPTSFIQSTHNTVGAQIALGLSCKAYNVTYVHHGTSFEASLTDAMLTVDEGNQPVLVGGIEEVGDHTAALHKLIGHIKEKDTFKDGILRSDSKGVVLSEGAGFFTLEDQKTDHSYAELIDVKIFDRLKKENIGKKALKFLKENNIKSSEIDILILGIDGDIEFSSCYRLLQEGIFKDTQQLYYKHLSGTYNTASAFGLWTACKIIKSQKIPEILKINKKTTPSINYILLYNQCIGISHSFTLLKKC